MQFFATIFAYLLICTALLNFVWKFKDSDPEEIQACDKPVPAENEDIGIVNRIGQPSALSKAVVVSKYDKYTANMSTYAVRIVSKDAVPKAGLFSLAFLGRWLTSLGQGASIKTEQNALNTLSKRAFFLGAQSVKEDGRNVYFFSKLPVGRCVTDRFSKGGPMRKDRVRSLAAQLVLSVEAAHKQGISVGEVGPDSLYVDDHGKLYVISPEPLTWKLGVASSAELKFRVAENKDFCSDWYTVAQCLVSMIAGRFNKNSHPVDVIRKIIKTQNTVIEDLILKLASVSSDHNMAQIVKNHQFFTGIDWSSFQPVSSDDVKHSVPAEDIEEIFVYLQHYM